MMADRATEITGRHVLIGMLSLFAVVLAVNGVFVYFALTSFTGLETEDAYRRGLAYNQTIAAADEQTERAWRVELNQNLSTNGHDWHLSVGFQDRYGTAITGLDVSAFLRRPSHSQGDRRLVLGPVGDGRYETKVPWPGSGQWLVTLEAEQEGELLYRSLRRFHLQGHP